MRLTISLCALPGAAAAAAHAPSEIQADASWTVRELGREVGARLRGAAVSLVLNPARDGVLPPQSIIGDVFAAGDTVQVVADAAPGAVAIAATAPAAARSPKIPIT
eukprot:6317535-Prymnesium_polylepis.4